MSKLSLLRSLISTAVLALTFAATPAKAAFITVNSVQYDVVTVTDSYSNIFAQIQSTPWWGTGAVNTIAFVNALGSTFGFPNLGGGGTHRTPYFAYQLQSIFPDTLFITQGLGLGGVVQAPSSIVTYAVLNSSPIPEPATLGLVALGLISAVGARRKAA
ncbi:PEP-CTERM sorting domain-containing protein [Methylovulum psychrotolerans]|uniref:PEP-CTERM sorting domain-containing protein n=1 Tax=Methylovulum psychrotolerans TaxID=1704499 RepID=UPI001BFF5BE9|nr:PEP-CTERM sorting domain-containing protein [Methylovulum psychrotolerans]MBT9096410.1 PEP-CTERM sorting domain-containing protein [Methylovulum psychrotolerans]